MYDNATVLDYEGRKIWIKRVARDLYCVNGVYIDFNDMDVSDIKVIADALDDYYSPLFAGEINDTSILHFPKNNNGEYMLEMAYFSDCTFDISNAGQVKSDFDLWFASVGDAELYINDRRNEDINTWLV